MCNNTLCPKEVEKLIEENEITYGTKKIDGVTVKFCVLTRVDRDPLYRVYSGTTIVYEGTVLERAIDNYNKR